MVSKGKLATATQSKKICEVSEKGIVCPNTPLYSVVLYKGRNPIRMCEKHKDFYEKGSESITPTK